MVALFIAFAVFCAFVAYAPKQLVEALLAGTWALMAAGTLITVGLAFFR